MGDGEAVRELDDEGEGSLSSSSIRGSSPSSPSSISGSSTIPLSSARPGNCVRTISSCSRINCSLLPLPSLALFGPTLLLLILRGIDRSWGISRSSSGGARSIAAKRDCSQSTKVSILWQESRNCSVSARTRMTYRFLRSYVLEMWVGLKQ